MTDEAPAPSLIASGSGAEALQKVETEAEKNAKGAQQAMKAIADRGDKIIKELQAVEASLETVMNDYFGEVRRMKGSSKRSHGRVASILRHLIRVIELNYDNQNLVNTILNNRLMANEDLANLVRVVLGDKVEGFTDALMAKANEVMAERKAIGEKRMAEAKAKQEASAFDKAVAAAKNPEEAPKPTVIQVP